MNKTNCNKCKKEIDILEVFPKNICLSCHEKTFDLKSVTAENLADSFKKTIC